MVSTNTSYGDYINIHFEHVDLSRIVREPTPAAILVLVDEVRANAQSVDCDLGGGAHGHLGLVISDVVYASITGTTTYESGNAGTNHYKCRYTICHSRQETSVCFGYGIIQGILRSRTHSETAYRY